jgi:hypothetical protein
MYYDGRPDGRGEFQLRKCGRVAYTDGIGLRSFVAPTLVQICGKPRELSFKARGLLFAGWLVPSWFTR